MSAPYLRCTRCSLEQTEQEAQGLRCCPRCGTTGVPMLVSDDVTINVNWHELRILAIWAENWAERFKEKDGGGMQRIVNIIAGRLHAQYPEKAALTLTGELGAVRRWAEEQGSSMEVQGFSPDADAEEPLA